MLRRLHLSIPKGLAIGSRASEVRAILGGPFRLEGRNLVYSLSEETPGEDTLILGGTQPALANEAALQAGWLDVRRY